MCITHDRLGYAFVSLRRSTDRVEPYGFDETGASSTFVSRA